MYASVLAFLSFLSAKWRASLIRQSNLVLAGTWGTLAYRDIWPLATYNLRPKDQLDAAFWVRFGLLSVSGIAIPLFIPREYVPVDPKVSTTLSSGIAVLDKLLEPAGCQKSGTDCLGRVIGGLYLY